MGPRLGRVEYAIRNRGYSDDRAASMGPRLGRVEYKPVACVTGQFLSCFNGATLRTRGIRSGAHWTLNAREPLQWGHA